MWHKIFIVKELYVKIYKFPPSYKHNHWPLYWAIVRLVSQTVRHMIIRHRKNVLYCLLLDAACHCHCPCKRKMDKVVYCIFTIILKRMCHVTDQWCHCVEPRCPCAAPWCRPGASYSWVSLGSSSTLAVQRWSRIYHSTNSKFIKYVNMWNFSQKHVAKVLVLSHFYYGINVYLKILPSILSMNESNFSEDMTATEMMTQLHTGY